MITELLRERKEDNKSKRYIALIEWDEIKLAKIHPFLFEEEAVEYASKIKNQNIRIEDEKPYDFVGGIVEMEKEYKLRKLMDEFDRNFKLNVIKSNKRSEQERIEWMLDLLRKNPLAIENIIQFMQLNAYKWRLHPFVYLAISECINWGIKNRGKEEPQRTPLPSFSELEAIWKEEQTNDSMDTLTTDYTVERKRKTGRNVKFVGNMATYQQVILLKTGKAIYDADRSEILQNDDFYTMMLALIRNPNNKATNIFTIDNIRNFIDRVTYQRTRSELKAYQELQNDKVRVEAIIDEIKDHFTESNKKRYYNKQKAM